MGTTPRIPRRVPALVPVFIVTLRVIPPARAGSVGWGLSLLAVLVKTLPLGPTDEKAPANRRMTQPRRQRGWVHPRPMRIT
jgi:hypothetical protein